MRFILPLLAVSLLGCGKEPLQVEFLSPSPEISTANGGVVTREYRLTNACPNTLEISEVKRQCGCQQVRLSSSKIAPGDSAVMSVNMTVNLSDVGKSKQLLVAYQKEDHEYELLVDVPIGDVHLPLLSKKSVDFGRVAADELPVTRSLKVNRELSSEQSLTVHSRAGANVRGEVDTGTIKVHLLPGFPGGRFCEFLDVRWCDEVGREMRESVECHGLVTSEFSAFPPTLILPTRGTQLESETTISSLADESFVIRHVQFVGLEFAECDYSIHDSKVHVKIALPAISLKSPGFGQSMVITLENDRSEDVLYNVPIVLTEG